MLRIFFVLPLRFDASQLTVFMEYRRPNTQIVAVRASNVRNLATQMRMATDRSAPVLFGSFAVARPALGSINEWRQPGDSQEWANLDALIRDRGGRVFEFHVQELPNDNDIKVIRMAEPFDDFISMLTAKS